MRQGILVAFLLGLGLGVVLTDIAWDMRMQRMAAPVPVKRAVVMTCAHWNAVGQPWRCV